jgi:hypothetical protein
MGSVTAAHRRLLEGAMVESTGGCMIRRLEQSHDHIVGYSLSGEVSDEEYIQAASELRDDVARHGRLRLLFRLSELSLSSFVAALDERFRFVNEHQDDIERVAVVTDDTTPSVMAKVAETLRDFEVETFSRDEESKAWAWLE